MARRKNKTIMPEDRMLEDIRQEIMSFYQTDPPDPREPSSNDEGSERLWHDSEKQPNSEAADRG